jgi:hypothetical protein
MFDQAIFKMVFYSIFLVVLLIQKVKPISPEPSNFPSKRCGSETIYFGSGSELGKVSDPDPDP